MPNIVIVLSSLITIILKNRLTTIEERYNHYVKIPFCLLCVVSLFFSLH